MAFPTVLATNTSTRAFSTSHPVALPAGIEADNLLIVVFDISNNSIITFPAGWTKFIEHNVGTLNKVVVAWRKADGTEGSSITVTSDASSRSAHHSYRITGAEDPTSQAPQGTVNGGSNPPSLSPAGGVKDYLWITAHGHNNTDLVTAPTNYGNTLDARITDTSCFSARRALNASSENPGSWGNGGQTGAISATIAVYPATAPPPTADLSGTVIGASEGDIRTGGRTITLTLSNGSWVAAGATFDAVRQAIIDGITALASPPNGWNDVVKPAIAVTDVVRTSDTVVTITLPSVSTYRISHEEEIRALIPLSATGVGWNEAVKAAIPVDNVVRTSDSVVTITLPEVPGYAISGDQQVTATIPDSAYTPDDSGFTDPLVASPSFTVSDLAGDDILADPSFTITSLPQASFGPASQQKILLLV